MLRIVPTMCETRLPSTMANVRRLLSKLSAKTASVEPSTLGMSPDRLTPADIAAAVGSQSLADGPRALIKVKWGLIDQEVYRLVLYLTKDMIETAKRRKWRTQANAAVWWRLSVLTLREAEVIWLDRDALRAGAEKCQSCHGVGLAVQDGVKFVTCPHCKGTTRRILSERRKAYELGVDKKSWKHTWDYRYGVASTKIHVWEGVAISELHARLA